jgi:hypothetical protein
VEFAWVVVNGARLPEWEKVMTQALHNVNRHHISYTILPGGFIVGNDVPALNALPDDLREAAYMARYLADGVAVLRGLVLRAAPESPQPAAVVARRHRRELIAACSLTPTKDREAVAAAIRHLRDMIQVRPPSPAVAEEVAAWSANLCRGGSRPLVVSLLLHAVILEVVASALRPKFRKLAGRWLTARTTPLLAPDLHAFVGGTNAATAHEAVLELALTAAIRVQKAGTDFSQVTIPDPSSWAAEITFEAVHSVAENLVITPKGALSGEEGLPSDDSFPLPGQGPLSAPDLIREFQKRFGYLPQGAESCLRRLGDKDPQCLITLEQKRRNQSKNLYIVDRVWPVLVQRYRRPTV